MKMKIVGTIVAKQIFRFSLYGFLFFLSTSNSNVTGQESDQFPMNCGTEQVGQIIMSPSGGPYLPITGVNKALLVFVRFSDDHYEDSQTSNPSQEWPDTLNGLPAWAFDCIDTCSTGAHTEGSITDYFCKMSRDSNDGSHGKFHLIGKVYPELFIPSHESSWYENLSNHGEANAFIPVHKELIRHVDTAAADYGINLASYDLYTNGTTNRTPDGVFDMIIVVYRFHFGGYSGESSLRGGDYTGITLGGLSINSGFSNGSGIHQYGITLDHAVTLMAHEYAHRLLGSGHHEYIGMFGLMDGLDGSSSMSAYERETLNWIDPVEIDNDSLNIIMSDAISTSETSVIFKIPITNDEYFLLENRQRIFYIDSYPGNGDDTDYVLPGTGLMISHINKNAYYQILWEAADNTFHFRDQGKESDTYKPGNKIQFTPWTQPNSDTRSNSYTGIAITNIREDGSNIIIDVIQNFTSGQITENSWWEGTENITGDITVTSGDTLTVNSDANISIDPGAAINAYGTLIAEGTASDPITFTRSGSSGTWGGIRFYDSANDNSMVQYCNISHATYGVYCNRADITIPIIPLTTVCMGSRLFMLCPPLPTIPSPIQTIMGFT